MITGMPSGRCLPLAFGIYTRRTGSGSQQERVRCTCTATSARAFEDKAICPSMPAVRRPALRWVTRRTLTSVFDHDPSIILCSDRTLAQSCSRVALNILRRSLATFSSWVRQSTASQSRTSSGPFTVTVSNLPLGSKGPRPRRSKAHLPTSAPFRARQPWPASGQFPRNVHLGAAAPCHGVLSPFGAPASACWASCPAEEFRPSCDRPTEPDRPGPDGVSTFRAHEIRPGWAPPIPRGQRCSRDRRIVSGRRLPPLPAARPYRPGLHPVFPSCR